MLAQPEFYRDFCAPRHWWFCLSKGMCELPDVFKLLGYTKEAAGECLLNDPRNSRMWKERVFALATCRGSRRTCGRTTAFFNPFPFGPHSLASAAPFTGSYRGSRPVPCVPPLQPLLRPRCTKCLPPNPIPASPGRFVSHHRWECCGIPCSDGPPAAARVRGGAGSGAGGMRRLPPAHSHLTPLIIPLCPEGIRSGVQYTVQVAVPICQDPGRRPSM